VRTSSAISELDFLRSEVCQLQDLMKNLSTYRSSRIALPPPLAIAHPALVTGRTSVKTPPFVGITNTLGVLPSTMSPSGKRPGHSLAATGIPGLVPSHLFFIMDHNQGLRFLVDTGAEVSVLPPTCADRRHPSESLTLQAVNDRDLWYSLPHPQPWSMTHLRWIETDAAWVEWLGER
jgi:hypothetical protein